MTAYALLTLAAKGDFVEGLPVLKWITEQRNPNGGFSSTQVYTVELQWLEHLWSHENMFETGIVRANMCYHSGRSGGIIRIYSRFSLT